MPTLPNPDDTNYNHMALHYEAKLEIRRRPQPRGCGTARQIIVGTGSTCAMFAAQVAETRRNVTILTNSAYVAANLCKEPDGRIILLGGQSSEALPMHGGAVGQAVLGSIST